MLPRKGDGLCVACRVNRTDLLEERGPPQRSFPRQNSTRCVIKASVCMGTVRVCVSVIILTCVALCADTTPPVWTPNACKPSNALLGSTEQFLPVPPFFFISLPPSHNSADLTSPHPSLFFLSCPNFPFSIYGVLSSLRPQGLHAEFIFKFPFHNSLSPQILLN